MLKHPEAIVSGSLVGVLSMLFVLCREHSENQSCESFIRIPRNKGVSGASLTFSNFLLYRDYCC